MGFDPKFMADSSKYLQENGLFLSDETRRQVEAVKGTRADGGAPVLSVGLIIRPIIYA